MRRLVLATLTTGVFLSLPTSSARADSREELRRDFLHVRAVCVEHGYRSDNCRNAFRAFVNEHRELLEEIARERHHADHNGDHDYGDHRCGDREYH